MSEPETKERLIQVALELFASRGFAGTSIRDIAKAMDMSISNIYHYYGSKEGILLAIFDRSSRLLIEELERVAQLDLPPLERFSVLLETHIGLAQRVENEAKIYAIDLDQFPEGSREAMRVIQRRILDIYVDQLQQLQELGVLRSERLTVLAFNLLGLVNWPLRWFKPGKGLTLDDVSEEILDFAINGALLPEAAQELAESRLVARRSG